MRRAVVSCCLAVMAVLSFASPAIACTIIPGPQLSDLWPGEKPFRSFLWPVVGVFESETIERSPPDGDGEWSITVVTRYWGLPPPNTGAVKHGPFQETTCPLPQLGAVGDYRYGYVFERADGERQIGGGILGVGSMLSAQQEAMLAERFGPPTAPTVVFTPPRAPTVTTAPTTSAATASTTTTQGVQDQPTTTESGSVLAADSGVDPEPRGHGWLVAALVGALTVALAAIAMQNPQRKRNRE